MSFELGSKVTFRKEGVDGGGDGVVVDLAAKAEGDDSRPFEFTKQWIVAVGRFEDLGKKIFQKIRKKKLTDRTKVSPGSPATSLSHSPDPSKRRRSSVVRGSSAGSGFGCLIAKCLCRYQYPEN